MSFSKAYGGTPLPSDHLPFSFSPSSPPSSSIALPPASLPFSQKAAPFHFHTTPTFHERTSTPEGGELAESSSISPSLYSASSATTHLISQSISHNLGPSSPVTVDLLMEEDALAGSVGSLSTVAAGKRAAVDMEDTEDVQRRGPPQSDTPGGDCKSLCVRHQRMANGGTNLMLQKSIENLPAHDQTAVNTIWSLFSSSPSRRRLLILRGLLTIACPSQLTFLQDMLTLEMRLDPLDVLPREVCLKVFGYLDAISLGRAAQVSKTWKSMADDDFLWRTMCEQHIERKCEKCGWGLPLLGERKRKLRGAMNSLPSKAVDKASNGGFARPSPSSEPTAVRRENEVNEATAGLPRTSTVDSELLSETLPADSEQAALLASCSSLLTTSANHAPSTPTMQMVVDTAIEPFRRPLKRSKTQSPAPSRSTTPVSGSPGPSSSRGPGSNVAAAPHTRPWKTVYCERLAIERNWRRGSCVTTVLSAHTDAITCLQVAEDLPHPSFPVLMTGSWDRSVRIWNLETGKEVGVLRGHTRGVRALQFDALKLVTGSMDSTLKIWNWRTGECMRTLRGHRDAVICLTYDKQLLVSGSADSTIRVWDFGTGEVYTLRGHMEWVNSVVLWNSRADCEPSSGSSSTGDGDLAAPASNPETARASSKGKFLFSASDDNMIRVWDLYTRQCVRVLSGHVAQVQSLRVITSDVVDEQAAQFPPSALQPPLSRSSSTVNKSNSKALTRNSSALATNGTTHGTANAYEGMIDSVALHASASGLSCTTPGLDGLSDQNLSFAQSYDLSSSSTSPNTSTGNLPALDFAADKKPWVISASLDNTIKVWDVETGACQRTLFGHIEGVWDVDVDKLRIISGSHDRTLKIWDKDTGKCLHTLVGHTSAVTAVTLQDQYVVTGSDDGNVRLWNFARSQPTEA